MPPVDLFRDRLVLVPSGATIVRDFDAFAEPDQLGRCAFSVAKLRFSLSPIFNDCGIFTAMILLADTIPPDVNVAVPQMEGVTTAIVAFIFVCVIYPALVKHKTQFYGAFVSVLLIILLHSLNMMFGTKSAGFQVFAGSVTGLLQIVAIVMLFMGCGGVGVKQLAGEMARAYEVMRRGEEEKTVIIPIGGEQPMPRQQPRRIRCR